MSQSGLTKREQLSSSPLQVRDLQQLRGFAPHKLLGVSAAAPATHVEKAYLRLSQDRLASQHSMSGDPVSPPRPFSSSTTALKLKSLAVRRHAADYCRQSAASLEKGVPKPLKEIKKSTAVMISKLL